MDGGGELENLKYRMDCHRLSLWNVISNHGMDGQNVFNVDTQISILRGERDTAIEQRDHALAEKKVALAERDAAIQQRDAAVSARDIALRERDNAIAAFQFQESTMNSLWNGVAHGLKHANHPTDHHSNNAKSAPGFGEDCITDALPISATPHQAAKSDQSTEAKIKKNCSRKPSKSLNKLKKLSEDLNRPKAGWDAQGFGSTMPAPVCSCTGLPRQCYKWGSGGWQSSCCTTTLSEYPLPQMPNKKHSRIGGRKMRGSVFSRLLTQAVAAGHDLSIPLDLKNYWSKHGTNRYITIK